MGCPSCLAALGREFSNRGTFILHDPVGVLVNRENKKVDFFDKNQLNRMQWQFPFTGCRIRKVALIRSYLGQRQVSHSRATATGRKFVTHLERIRNSPQKPLCLILVWRAPFSNCQPCCFLPSSLCSIKKRFIMGGWVKR